MAGEPPTKLLLLVCLLDAHTRLVLACPLAIQIFNELDLKEEAEMLELAVFLDALIKEFGSENDRHRDNRSDSLQNLDADEDVDEAYAHERQAEDFDAMVSPAEKTGTSFYVNQSDSIVKSLIAEGGSLENFVLPKGSPTEAFATNIVEVYRRGGKVACYHRPTVLLPHCPICTLQPARAIYPWWSCGSCLVY